LILIVPLVVIKLALIIGNIYRAYHLDPNVSAWQQLSGSIFGLVMALGALLLVISAGR
jgi:membrane associated rhomboid family serine protease